MDFNDDRHLDVCQAIEIQLKAEYEIHPDLTDTLCVFGLESAIIATKKEFGLARSERVTDHPLLGGIIQRCVAVGLERIGKVNALTLKDYVARIDKIKKSVIRHGSLTQFATKCVHRQTKLHLVR